MTRQEFARNHPPVKTEIWYGGPGLERSREQVQEAKGPADDATEVVVNGSQVWIVGTGKGQTTVIHTTGTNWTGTTWDQMAIDSS